MEDEGRLTVFSEFGNLLRRHRLAAGLSQEALAERASMSSIAISALERGQRRRPQRETLALLIGALPLDEAQRTQFEAAARSGQGYRRKTSVTSGPWSDDGAASLPSALTSFVGREVELAEIAALVRAHRLVTITGTGGVGKTQTALRTANAFIASDGVTVRFVSFAAIRDSSLLVTMVASVLNIQVAPDRPLLATVIGFLKNRTMLLIFDNCEHVIAKAASLVSALLSGCPQVRILATSRESLNTAGEYAYRLPSLGDSSAVMLFMDRATAADTRFALSDETEAIVAEICHRLDGIPLAIELAVARVKALSLKTLAEKLDDRFRILTGGDRASLPRQQTMRATIEWSYDLLASREQLLFARLGVFSGSFSLNAATTVCGESLDENDICDLLASLTDKSLVVADTSGMQERYQLLESTAAYALERLVESGERERLARRHAKYFRDQAEAAYEGYGASSSIAWIASVELDLGNYRAALEWALIHKNDVVLGSAIPGALGLLWANAGLSVEGRYWIERALSRISEAEQPAIAARLQLALSLLLFGKRRYEAAQRATQLYESVGDHRRSAHAQRNVGWALFRMGQLEAAREAVGQALAASRACEDAWNVAYCLKELANIEWIRVDLSAGRELFAQALAGTEALGDELQTAYVLGDMAELEFAAGDTTQALCLATEAQEVHIRGKDATRAAIGCNNIAAYRIALGDATGARESAREGLRLARRMQGEQWAAIALQHLALLAALGGDPRCGAKLLGFVDARYGQLGTQRESTEQWGYDELLTALRGSLSDDEITKLAAEGAAWREDQAAKEALKA